VLVLVMTEFVASLALKGLRMGRSECVIVGVAGGVEETVAMALAQSSGKGSKCTLI